MEFSLSFVSFLQELEFWTQSYFTSAKNSIQNPEFIFRNLQKNKVLHLETISWHILIPKTAERKKEKKKPRADSLGLKNEKRNTIVQCVDFQLRSKVTVTANYLISDRASVSTSILSLVKLACTASSIHHSDEFYSSEFTLAMIFFQKKKTSIPPISFRIFPCQCKFFNTHFV